MNFHEFHPGFYEVAELLLSREAKVDLMCENGGAPIHIAAENGHAKMLKLLLQHKAGYNAGNPATALVIAAGKGLTDCIKCLLKAGADANISDEDGKLPVQIAACQGWKECVEILFPVTTPLAEYATWSIDGIIQHEKTTSSEPQLQVSDLDDKENVVSDDNTNKDKQPHQSKLCSKKGKALTTVEENGGGIETLMSGLNLGPEDPSDKAWRPLLRRSTRARQHNVRISGPEWAR
ncbi:uncharacterized protein [Miscanthus floridulus]|uniref:uncharacterized protein isoform X1 n=2 Tax=Miscanthus floridulus TaxID=154761 RepID=UPI00345AD0F3